MSTVRGELYCRQARSCSDAVELTIYKQNVQKGENTKVIKTDNEHVARFWYNLNVIISNVIMIKINFHLEVGLNQSETQDNVRLISILL